MNTARGFSLVELMIALTLGLIVLAAAVAVELSGAQLFRQTQGMSRVQEDVRTVLLLMDQNLREAGYRSDPRHQTDPARYFGGTRAAVSGSDTQDATSVYPFAHDALAGTGYLAVSFLGDDDGGISTCLGSVVLGDQLATSVFYIGQGAGDAVPSLYCAAEVSNLGEAHALPAPAAAPLLLGATALNLDYGIDSDADGRIDRYADAATVSSLQAWNAVASLQLSIDIRSAQVVDATGSVPGLAGGRLQRTLEQTVYLRNLLKP